MKSVKSLVIAGALLLSAGMMQARGYTIDLSACENDIDVTLSGGSHNEPPFLQRVLKGTPWRGDRDCTKAITLSIVPGFGQEQQSTWTFQLTDQKCHKPDWKVTISGSVTKGFTFIPDNFQND